MKKRSDRWLWGPAAVLAAGAWHYLDVKAGAAQSGDMWLKGTYLWLLAAVMVGLVGLGYVLAGKIPWVQEGKKRTRESQRTGGKIAAIWGLGAVGHNRGTVGDSRGAVDHSQRTAGDNRGTVDHSRGAAGDSKGAAGRSGKRGSRGWSLEHIYLCAGLFLGGLYMLVLPPLSAPDEISHYISAYQLSSRMLGRPSNAVTGHVLVQARDKWLEDVGDDYEYEEGEDEYLRPVAETTDNSRFLGKILTEETYRTIKEQGLTGRRYPAAAGIWEAGGQNAGDGGTGEENTESYGGAASYGPSREEPLLVSVYPPVVTTSAAYIPQALGVALARLLDMNSICLLYMGRLFNLLFFVTMTFLSMKRLPFGREVLFGVALLPMTLHLSASFSYDVMIMGCMFYFTAMCLDLAWNREKVRLFDVAVLALLMAVAGPCKMVYGVLMGLCLLIPVKKFGGWRQWAVSAVCVALAWGLAMAAVNGQTIISYATAAEGSVQGSVPGVEEAGYSFRMLLHQPKEMVRMFYQTFLWQAEHYHMTMTGAWLGNLDQVLDVPYAVVILFTACLLCLAAKKPGETINMAFGARIWIWVVCAACVGVIMLSMLVALTPVGALVISGVQGRYFLPFLPILLISLKNDFIILTKDTNRSILYLMCCANGYVLLRLYSIVSMRL